jgi:hypothetical protein
VPQPGLFNGRPGLAIHLLLGQPVLDPRTCELHRGRRFGTGDQSADSGAGCGADSSEVAVGARFSQCQSGSLPTAER